MTQSIQTHKTAEAFPSQTTIHTNTTKQTRENHSKNNEKGKDCTRLKVMTERTESKCTVVGGRGRCGDDHMWGNHDKTTDFN